MNTRKISLFLLGGAFAILAIAALLFPFKRGAAAGDRTTKTQSVKQIESGKPANYDAFGASLSEDAARQIHAAQIENGRMVQTEPRLGVPTFLWANAPAASGKTQTAADARLSGDAIEKAARAALGDYANRYRLQKSDVAAAQAVSIHDTGSGAIVVKFRQSINGTEVFRDELNVIMNRDLQLVALSGYLTGTDASGNRFAGQNFELQPTDALSKVVQDLTGANIDAALFRQLPDGNFGKKSGAKAANPYLLFAPAVAVDNVRFNRVPARVKAVYFHLPEGFVPAYYVETNVVAGKAETDLYYSYVISALDGAILFRNNLTANESFAFRVWANPTTKIPFDGPQGDNPTPHPTGLPDNFRPPYVSPNDVLLQNAPFSRNDPWLPAGATVTTGNNADAYVDAVAPDGFNTGDYRATATGANQFLHTFDPNQSANASNEQTQGAIQQLFYNVNFLHDWFYDAGFNEAAGNAQQDNYGRGGLGGDRMRAEAQDYGGTNNANMSTPADGAQPRMQMYLFDAPPNAFLNINSPAAIAGQKTVGIATGFGAQTFDVTADIVAGLDNAAPATDACTTLTNTAEVAGKIVIVDRGTCNFSVKAQNVQTAGGIGVVVVNNVAGAPVAMGGTATNITIGAVMVSQADGQAIRNALTSGAVNARLFRGPGTYLDGTIDNQIVAHEWGHYISNRLVGNSNGLGNTQGGGMGEGWGDFHSLLMTVRAEDAAVAGNSTFNGVYAMAGYATSASGNSYYFGIRRAPYSTDFAKNPFTFKHIQEGVALPTNAPLALNGLSNAEVHNTGEVWTSMLWECYASLLRDTLGNSPRLTFDQAQTRMKNYLVAAYKMTPVSPTFIEARDAVLVAAYAGDPVDFQRFAAAFARRGAGSGAVAPDRFSTTNAGVVESFTLNGSFAVNNVFLTDNVRSFDNDGYIDEGERGLLTVSITNNGFVALNQTTATVTSGNSGIRFPNGATVNLPASQPYQTVTASVLVEGRGLPQAITAAQFTITATDPAAFGESRAAVTTNFWTYVNVDERLAATAIDNVEASQTPWTFGRDTSLNPSNSGQWRRAKTAVGNYAWYGPDVSEGSDQYLITPQLTVGGSGTINLQFDHNFSFETDATGNYDGGVIEMSVNGGAWTDIGTTAYNGTLVTYSGNVNPLQGRPAFVGSSNGTVHASLTTAALAGSIVQIRFRVGSDSNVGAAGWFVDNIAFNGIANTPFAQLVPEATPTAAAITVAGRILAPSGAGVRNARVTFTDGTGAARTATTTPFGNYTLTDLAAGQTYVVSIAAKGFAFQPQAVALTGDLSDLNFTAEP